MRQLTTCRKLAPRPPCGPLPTPPPTQNPGTDRRTLPIARRPYREPSQRNDLGRMDHVRRHRGAPHWLLERSTGSGSSNAHPLFAMCYSCGEIELPPVPPPPEQLSYFFTAPTPQAYRPRQHIRQHNTALAFTLLGVEVDLRPSHYDPD